jgi:hypothetical protein
VPCSAIRCASRAADSSPAGIERLSPSRKRTAASAWRASGPSSRRHEAPWASSAQYGQGPGRRWPPDGCPAGWRRRSPAPPTARHGPADRTRRRTATPTPKGALPSTHRG